jgi:hypothetical protein
MDVVTIEAKPMLKSLKSQTLEATQPLFGIPVKANGIKQQLETTEQPDYRGRRVSSRTVGTREDVSGVVGPHREPSIKKGDRHAETEAIVKSQKGRFCG